MKRKEKAHTDKRLLNLQGRDVDDVAWAMVPSAVCVANPLQRNVPKIENQNILLPVVESVLYRIHSLCVVREKKEDIPIHPSSFSSCCNKNACSMPRRCVGKKWGVLFDRGLACPLYNPSLKAMTPDFLFRFFALLETFKLHVKNSSRVLLPLVP